MVTMALIGGALLVPGVAVAAPNPPGNNGTIKVDAQLFDAAPDDEPHVGCTFQVDFYGYDEGGPGGTGHLRGSCTDAAARW
jgi:hypothetical protein